MTDDLEPAELSDERALRESGILLSVRDLTTIFNTEIGVVHAVDRVSFDVRSGEVFAVVGESGSGKTVTALSILGLIPEPAGQIVAGEVLYRGDDLVRMDTDRRREIRGDRIAMIFQDPLTSLNPVHRVGDQIIEVIRAHRDLSKAEATSRMIELLDVVGIPNAKDRWRHYPHEFSGGMRQRVMIAMGMALDPDLLIADEPTTALDVTVQAQILEVLLSVRDRFDTAIMLITHDLGVVAEVADRLMVMYAGKKVEEGEVDTVFGSPKHPYTWGLLASTTRIDRPRLDRAHQIPGAPPSLIAPPPACRFAPRCPYVQPVCRSVYPELRWVGPGQLAACHFADADGWDMDSAPRISAERAAEMADAP